MKSFVRWTIPKATRFGVAAAVSLVCFAFGMPDPHRAPCVVHADAQQSQPSTTVAAAGITLHSVSVDLPVSDRLFPGGADAEAINNNCLGCHSAGMVLTQPPLTRAVWQQEVTKMRTQYKAPVAASDDPAIVAYLFSHDGAK